MGQSGTSCDKVGQVRTKWDKVGRDTPNIIEPIKQYFLGSLPQLTWHSSLGRLHVPRS